MSIIFDDSFPLGSFSAWEDAGFANARAGWGCANGYGFTCSNTVIAKALTVADDVTYPPLLTASTYRLQGSVYSSTGVIPNFQSDVNGAMSGIDILSFSAPLDVANTVGESTSFTGFLNIRTGGILQLFISDNNKFGSVGTVVNSTSGVWPVDGSPHALQVLLNFTSFFTLDYTVVVDNVVVISGTYTTQNTSPRNWKASYYTPGVYVNYQGVRYITLRGTRVNLPPQVTTNWGRFQVDNTATQTSWLPCPMPTLTYSESCSPMLGSLNVMKQTSPPGSPQQFLFTATGLSPTSFTLEDGETQQFLNVTPGSGYGILETTSQDWVTTYTVSNDSPINNITVNAGETVVVTVTNTASTFGSPWKLQRFDMKIRLEGTS